MTKVKELEVLINEYMIYKAKGKLNDQSEESTRSWIDKLLIIFGWDTDNTRQVKKEKQLSKVETSKVTEIASTHKRPDYSLLIGNQKVLFVDAKAVSVNLYKSKKACFQIKSYGWSISSPFAILTNFEELVIYDTTYVPNEDDDPSFGRIYLQLNEYLENFDLLSEHLSRIAFLSGDVYKDYGKSNKTIIDKRRMKYPDETFAEQLSKFRLLLANNILKNNGELINGDNQTLSLITQQIINRILFLRVCEAKNLEEKYTISEFVKNDFWSEFKSSSYNKYYHHYDGKLFDRSPIIQKLQIDNDILNDFTKLLYYPSPYRFDVIPTKLLSDIYEIFLSRKLYIENNEVFDEFKIEFSKTKGAVSTPKYIAEQVVNNTIDIDYNDIIHLSDLTKFKLIDNACGSGIFMIESYNFLSDILIKSYSKGIFQEEEYIIDIDGRQYLSLSAKLKLISECLFGVDIDLEATEVATMSLCLKVIDETDEIAINEEIGLYGEKILNGVGKNIKCGNSLVEVDILDIYPDLCKPEKTETLNKINPFEWLSEDSFKSVFDNNHGFDYVITNPPYVEVKRYKAELPYMYSYLKATYDSCEKDKVDLAIPFIEKSLQLINPNGKIGMIVQDRFFKTEYGEKIRTYLTNKNRIVRIIDFDSNDIFKNRITYASIMILASSNDEKVKYQKIMNSPEEMKHKLQRILEETEEINIEPEALGKKPWIFSNEISSILKRFENSCLSDYCDIKVGIQALWVKAYHLKYVGDVNDSIMIVKSSLLGELRIEKKSCRELLVNEKIYQFMDLTPKTYVIFPYKVIKGTKRSLGHKKYSKLFPLAGQYLSDIEKVLKSNVQTPIEYRGAPIDDWILYTRESHINEDYPKVVIPMTAQDVMASFTSKKNIYCDNSNMNYLELNDTSLNNLIVVSAILNSTPFSVLARTIANPQSGDYFKFSKQFIGPVPFPINGLANSEKYSELLVISKGIIKLQRIFLLSEKKKRKIIKMQLRKLWSNLDECVIEMYNLNKDEVKVIRSIGRHIDRVEVLHKNE